MNRIVDNVYCINLASSKDRRTAMVHEFSKHSLPVSFIEAISVESPEYCLVQRDWSVKQRCYCVEKCRHRARKLRAVETAIALSHYKTYQEIISSNCDIALICEDDIIFHENINRIFQDIFDQSIINALLSDEPVIVFLGGRRDNPNLSKDCQKIVPSKTGSYSNYCYVLNFAGAKLLVSNFFPIIRPEDSYKRYLINKGLLKCYQVIPSLVAELSAGVNHKQVYSRLSR